MSRGEWLDVLHFVKWAFVGVAVTSRVMYGQDAELADFEASPSPPHAMFAPELFTTEVPTPSDNPNDEGSLRLSLVGKKLAFAKILSARGTMSCTTCHDPERGFTDGREVAVGENGTLGIRNTPTLVNVSFKRKLFEDARSDFLEGQAEQPIIAAAEMGNQNIGQVVNRLNNDPAWRAEAEEAFGGPWTRNNLLQSLASWQRTLVVNDTLAHRLRRGQDWALGDYDESVARGAKLFFGKANCTACHSDESFAGEGDEFVNTGIEFYYGSRVQGGDLGLRRTTNLVNDTRKFKVKTLLMCESTGPYMHSGRVPSLRMAVQYYRRVFEHNEYELEQGRGERFLDPRLADVKIDNKQEEDDLVTFLEVGFKPKDYPRVTEPPNMPGGNVVAVRQQQPQQQDNGGGRRIIRGRRGR